MTIYSISDMGKVYLVLKLGKIHNKILSEEWINANLSFFPL